MPDPGVALRSLTCSARFPRDAREKEFFRRKGKAGGGEGGGDR